MNEIKSTDTSRSWFCVWHDPAKTLGDSLSMEEMVQKAVALWVRDFPERRSCAINYEISDNNSHHMHMVLEDSNKSRFSALQKLFPGIHIEITKGSKRQAEDYINKRGSFQEKGHTLVVPPVYHGEIAAKTAVPLDGFMPKNVLAEIEILLEKGCNPEEIMRLGLQYRKNESLIRKAYFAKRAKETPPKRDVKVFWHVGQSGTGKSYTYVTLCEELGEDAIYLLTDYSTGAFDLYLGEPCLFLDEFKGSFPFEQFLTILDGYKVQQHARYANIRSLWSEIHITSVFPPEEIYSHLTTGRDSVVQILRRIEKVIYHYTENNAFKTFSMIGKEYKNYQDLITHSKYDLEDFKLIDQGEQSKMNLETGENHE